MTKSLMKLCLSICFLIVVFPGNARSSNLHSFKHNSSIINRSFNLKDSLNQDTTAFVPTKNTNAKSKTFQVFLQTGLSATSNDQVPFWMRSQQYGSIPLHGTSGSLVVGTQKRYRTDQKLKLDWAAAVEARLNEGYKTQGTLIEAYLKGRLGPIELKAGRSREIMGLVDSTLSTGAFSISGNALGIPKVEISFPDYWDIPFTGGLIAIKGNFVHGWVGTYQLNNDPERYLVNESKSYLHQKSFYGRFGKPNWKLKLYGGFNHQVIWGNEDQIWANWSLSKLETWKYVVIGKKYGVSNVPNSKIGNHIGSIDQALELELGNCLLTGYHQLFFDVGALAYLANVKDGLWGLSLQNRKTPNHRPFWKKTLIEFLYTKSQGGEVDSKPRASGDEDYYNNFLYYNGWSYQGDNLGNVLITPKKYMRSELPSPTASYFPNNRVIALHSGTEIQFHQWNLTLLLTYSENFGNYRTSPASRGAGDEIRHYPPPYFPEVNQFSGAIKANRQLKNNFELNLEFAIDQGDLLYNSVGGSISLTKHW